MSRLHSKINLLSLILLLSAIISGCTPDKKTLAPIDDAEADTYFPINLGDHSIQLQLALNQDEQSRGLMHRKSMNPDHGMIFVFEAPSRRSFWMKNTRIPLDIGYFDAGGHLSEVHQLIPFDESPVPSRSSSILLALEMNQGWFARNNIQPGAKLDLESLITAIKARGYKPEQFRFSIQK